MYNGLCMKKQIEIGGKNIEYTLYISRRARGMRLTIYGDGHLVATVPRGMKEDFATRFIMKKSRWVLDTLERFKEYPVKAFAKGSKKDFLMHQERARARVRERLAHFSAIYHVSYRRISIRNQKTRWGSCSRTGNLNFNYKIVLLPPRHADYIVVHELCHIKEFNHSKKFWDLVAATMPDYHEIRAALKKGGGGLV